MSYSTAKSSTPSGMARLAAAAITLTSMEERKPNGTSAVSTM